MKKIALFLFAFLFIIILSGCGKYDESDIIKDLEKRINKSDSYKLSGLLEITNNEDTYQYDVNVNYKKDNNYRISLVNKSNNHEQIILKNKEGVYVVTPSLNKSFKFQSDWPNNNSQIYLLKSIINDIKSDDKKTFKEENGKYIFITKVNYPNNNELKSQKITINKNLDIELIEVMNTNGASQMIMKVDKIDYGATFNDDYFDLDSIIEQIEPDENLKEQSENKQKNQTKKEDIEKNNSENNNKNDEQNENKDDKTDSSNVSTIEDIIYPLYIPTGTMLSNQEKITKTDGERVILTFDGEKPFLLVEETSSISDEFNVIPTFGDPYFLTDTIGALTDNSITWSSNGMDYYIVSDTMSQLELIEIASSITAIPTIK